MRKILDRLSDHFNLILFTLAMVIIFGLLLYSQSIVHDLRVQSRGIVEFYANIHSRSATEGDTTLTGFLFDQIIKEINFPIIYTDANKNPSYWRNIPVATDDNSPKIIAKVKQMTKKMEKETAPVPLTYQYADGRETILGYLFYGDSNLITRLIWLPYVEIGVISLFILVALFGFMNIKKSEEQFIWIGLTKETAHQLGTPLSSLMGWLELLQNGKHGEEMEKVLPEMGNDLTRLSKVAARFSQIGSRSGFKKHDVIPILKDAVKYFQRRLPQMGKEVKIVEHYDRTPQLNINRDLFEWVIENLIKNSLDALKKQKGVIKISAGFVEGKASQVYIDIKDNGKGIGAQNRRRVFKPGYSTKKRGWGLGLNLAKRIVEEFHHGKLYIKDTKANEGTTMRIVLKV
ncbi:HAMP domain-containing histidine kinase [candidate division KSB1 bacterium]|nr:HAMP domain-containing histidine kinase [candidate division KSB1 bacterium]MBL7094545.1 HAMP domain-containing histidine kinase [candidate division KSB1 bacterium]